MQLFSQISDRKSFTYGFKETDQSSGSFSKKVKLKHIFQRAITTVVKATCTHSSLCGPTAALPCFGEG